MTFLIPLRLSKYIDRSEKLLSRWECMPRKRITLKVRGEAYDTLMELSRIYGLNPQKVVEKLLINHQKSIRDDELCRKEFFGLSIVYITELPFSFPYECEMFELEVKGKRRAKIYIERVPK